MIFIAKKCWWPVLKNASRGAAARRSPLNFNATKLRSISIQGSYNKSASVSSDLGNFVVPVLAFLQPLLLFLFFFVFDDEVCVQQVLTALHIGLVLPSGLIPPNPLDQVLHISIFSLLVTNNLLNLVLNFLGPVD